jgi:hypothetical protein
MKNFYKILKGPGYFRPNINKFLEDASSSVQESID